MPALSPMKTLIVGLAAAGALSLAVTGSALAQRPPMPTETTGGTAGITTQVPNQSQQAADKAAEQLRKEKEKEKAGAARK